MERWRKVVTCLDRLEPISAELLTDGIRLACGLMAIAILFDLMLGHFGDYLTVYSYMKGASSAAFGSLDVAFIGSLLGDLYVKERRGL